MRYFSLRFLRFASKTGQAEEKILWQRNNLPRRTFRPICRLRACKIRTGRIHLKLTKEKKHKQIYGKGAEKNTIAAFQFTEKDRIISNKNSKQNVVATSMSRLSSESEDRSCSVCEYGFIYCLYWLFFVGFAPSW